MKGRKTHLKLFIWQECPMSLEGYRQFSKGIRGYMSKTVFKPFLRFDVHVSRISTARKIMALVEYFCGAGTWIVRGFSHGKNEKRIKQVRLAKVVCFEHGGGYRSRISDTGRLSRYWFFSGNERSALAISFLLLAFLPALIFGILVDGSTYLGWIARSFLRFI